MNKNNAAKLIQNWWRSRTLEQQLKEITKCFNRRKGDFLREPNNDRLTEYEKAAGFTVETRGGSKKFSMQLGYFMEDVYNSSKLFSKLKQDGKNGSCDGISSTTLFEAKNRHDTMKQSQAYNEIKPKLEHAILQNKSFILLVLVDVKNSSQIKPLHEGNGLGKIREIEGYDNTKHLWISGDEIYKYLFNRNEKIVKEHVIKLLTTLKRS